MYIMTCGSDEQCSKSIVQRKIQNRSKADMEFFKKLRGRSGAIEE